MPQMQIIGLSRDRKGLRVHTATMPPGSWWHVHSDEMSRYQRRAHRLLLKSK